MNKMYGMFMGVNSDGSTTTCKVKKYDTYEDMIADDKPGLYGIVASTNIVYHRCNGEWVQGFHNLDDVTSEAAYTAYEVTPTDVRYDIGEYKKTVTFADKGTFELSNQIPIPASMTEKLFVYTNIAPEDSDVMIDWGDGECTLFATATDLEVVLEDNFERKITVYHTYAKAGTYIVKIYGTQYWKLGHDEQSVTGNLMSRVFEDDLPIANHINSVATFCNRALRLLYVNVSSYHKLIYMPNMSYTFAVCSNLQYAYGLKRMYTLYSCSGMFHNDVSLIDTDFRIPATAYSFDNCFYKCGKLKTPIQNLFFEKGTMTFLYKTIGVRNLFNDCGSLTGTVPASILWNSENTFTNKETMFLNCSEAIRAQVPTSWGGLNTVIEAELVAKAAIKDPNYYSAYEVIALDKNVNIGELTKTVTFHDKGPFQLANKLAFSAGMTEKLIIGTNSDPSKSDVVIDWGDGTTTVFATATDLEVVLDDNFERKITVSHTYTTAGTYIVKIYGRMYHKLSHPETGGFNLISRVFEEDLPIASHVLNLSDFCRNAYRLLYVNVSAYNNLAMMANLVGLFGGCVNLLYAYGLKRMYVPYSLNAFFSGCINLIDTDFRAPSTCYDLAACFSNCSSLTTPVQNMFAEKGTVKFAHKTVIVTNMFRACPSMTGVVPAAILWESGTDFTGTESMFLQCSAEIRAQVPVSWGGSLDDDTVVTQEDKLVEKVLESLPAVAQVEF